MSLEKKHKAELVSLAWDPSIWEVEVGKRVQNHSWPHRRFEANLGYL